VRGLAPFYFKNLVASGSVLTAVDALIQARIGIRPATIYIFFKKNHISAPPNQLGEMQIKHAIDLMDVVAHTLPPR
jgi:hypothetical protein